MEKRYTKIIKPCRLTLYCPYGQLVEEYPISDEEDIKCKIFGHDCPAFYLSEPFAEDSFDSDISEEKFNEMFNELLKEMEP